MVKILNILIGLLVCSMAHAQGISVDDQHHSSSDLVDLLLKNSCVQATNVQSSSSTSVAYFNNNNTSFPISEGVIIRSGIAKYSEGSYTGNQLSSTVNTISDADLQEISAQTGQIATITDSAFLQFDFTPISSSLSFNFLFASNEYGEFQCEYNDVFAFVLTNLDTGISTNLALIPGTSTPISVKDIRDTAYNTSCQSQNPQLFSTYNVDQPNASTVNMKGYTIPLTASSELIPNTPYRIKLVIGDYNDPDFDSAIFLASGSFSATLDLGADATICTGDTITIDTELNSNEYAFEWTYDGNLLVNETSSSLSLQDPGSYSVKAEKFGNNCILRDTIVFSNLELNAPNDIISCIEGVSTHDFNLTENDATMLGIDDQKYEVIYYNSTAAILAQTPIADSELQHYESAGDETIYLKIYNSESQKFCDAELSFNLRLNSNIPLTSNELEVCSSSEDIVINLNQQSDKIRDELNAEGYDISYYLSASDAEAETNELINFYTVHESSLPMPIWLRIQYVGAPDCFVEIFEFDIVVNELPEVTEFEDVVACRSYTLPILAHGNYYTSPNGFGQQLEAGDLIEDSGRIYIFNGPDENGCTNESSFLVTLADEYEIPLEHCGFYTLPNAPMGDFYTASGGPNGSGSLIPPGTSLDQNQTVYHYAEEGGTTCRDEPFALVFDNYPEIDEPEPVITCNSYTLPQLTNGYYFNGMAGEEITQSKTIFIKSGSGDCINSSSFRITIYSAPDDVAVCGSYVLPDLEIGSYYTAPKGAGDELPFGTTITSSQELYVYDAAFEGLSCAENLSFSITIYPTPAIDTIEDVRNCISEPFVLPVLSHGSYFTLPDREGTQLMAGTEISTSQTIYINAMENGCTTENEVHIEIRDFPEVNNFTDVFTCEPEYELPELTNGSYYTEPGGMGSSIPSGTFIEETQTLYIYNAWEDIENCYSESVFKVNFLGVHLGEIENSIKSCDAYVLPELTVGHYFTEPNGQGQQMNPGDLISTSQLLYVYAENGNRFFCSTEEVIDITISKTPQLPEFMDVQRCGTYTLPELDTSEYEVQYFAQPNGVEFIEPNAYHFSVPGSYTIYIRAWAKDNSNCFDETSFKLDIIPLRTLEIPDARICIDYETGEIEKDALLESGLDPNEFTVNWYLNNELIFTGPSFTTREPGTYRVETVKLTPDLIFGTEDCNYSKTEVEVKESIAKFEAEVTDDFADIAIITIIVDSAIGTFEYSLNNGPFQTDTEFYDVPSGDHIITIRDQLGSCKSITLEVSVLKYPKFFTPNRDGFNDFWTIKDLEDKPNAHISIYDRFGKIILQFSPNENSLGWDGTLDHKDLPSTDYWFRADYGEEGERKVFKAHFTLKR